MGKPKLPKVNMASENLEKDNLEKLRSVFPQFVKDGDIDFDALKTFFEKEGVLPEGQEKYGLNWAGKSQAFKNIKSQATGTLVPDEKESKNFDNTENIFIEGDNLEVLKLLQKHYREKIKMIYIDPPYNTGKDFIYKDNFKENISDYYERTGQSEGGIKLTTNPESAGRYHSDWLTMMYPRLFLARNLLKDDGVIFISIDDNEVANLRMVMDEIFGEENFVASIIWERSYSPVNLKKHFSENHDYILAYSKNIELLDELSISRTEESDNRYSNPDNDQRGPWKSSDFSVGPENINNVYEIVTPFGRKVLPPKGRSWVVDKKKYENMLRDNRIWFGINGSNVPAQKRFLSEVQTGLTPTTLWKYKEVGHTQDARKETKTLFNGAAYFDYPKPVSLIKRIIGITTESNDIVLDFFAGSGTTAHAVMDLNAEDGGNRKWICVQLPEETDENSEARKAGFQNIAQIARERIRRAGEKISKESQSKLDLDSKRELDNGFKSYQLTNSRYRKWNVLTDKDDDATLRKQAKLFLERPLADKYDEKQVVYELMLKEGFSLLSEVKKNNLNGINCWDIDNWADIEETDTDKMFVCFENKLTLGQIDLAMTGTDEKFTFVCFDSALDDTTKANLQRRDFKVKVI